MNVKELSVANTQLQIRLSETKVLDAVDKLRLTKLKLQADMDRELHLLASDIEREKIQMEQQKNYLKAAQAELDRGYEA